MPTPRIPLTAARSTDPAQLQRLTRVEGIKLITPLQVEVSALAIQNDEEYLQADFMLARVKAALATWDQKISPVLTPLQKVLAEAKLAMDGAKSLDKEVRGPLEGLEVDIKGKMRNYKLLENQRVLEAQAAAAQAAAELRQRSLAAATAAAVAKTPQAKARLEQQQATLQAEAASVVEQAIIDTAPVKGAASSDRKVKKLRISNPVAFLAAVQDYEPRAGLYNMGHPPLTLLTHKMNRIGALTEKDSALETVLVELGKIHSVQPGVVLSWPGVTEFDDVIIANR